MGRGRRQGGLLPRGMLNDKLDERLRELISQWNIAERRIKQAENARAQEIVSSAIYESLPNTPTLTRSSR